MVGLSSYMFALRFGHSNLYSHQGEDELGRDAADSRRFANDQSLVHLEEEHVHFDFFSTSFHIFAISLLVQVLGVFLHFLRFFCVLMSVF